MKHVLTDNGSEFKKEFDQAVESHWHTYPRTPKMNAHCERFNRTLQDELVDYNLYDLVNTDEFNKKMVDYLLWYNLKRPHYALGQISPVDYIKINEDKYKKKCNMLWTHTSKIGASNLVVKSNLMKVILVVSERVSVVEVQQEKLQFLVF